MPNNQPSTSGEAVRGEVRRLPGVKQVVTLVHNRKLHRVVALVWRNIDSVGQSCATRRVDIRRCELILRRVTSVKDIAIKAVECAGAGTISITTNDEALVDEGGEGMETRVGSRGRHAMDRTPATRGLRALGGGLETRVVGDGHGFGIGYAFDWGSNGRTSKNEGRENESDEIEMHNSIAFADVDRVKRG